MKVSTTLVVANSVVASGRKAGLSGLTTCDDAKALNFDDSWHYNWGIFPDQHQMACAEKRAAEFVPMLWTCGDNCGEDLPDDYWSVWMKAGVKFLLGFNEPDNVNQANLTAQEAAQKWVGVQKLAQKFEPPLELVSPGMTHWSVDGTPWLDDFFGNCSVIDGCDPSLIKHVAFHDYSGDVDTIISNANGAAKRYGRKVWLTEFSVGSGEHREAQDKFMKEVIPALEAADNIYRYAWYTTRNQPADWVAESSLLPYYVAPWHKRDKKACVESEMKWLSGRSWGEGDLADCGSLAVADSDCTSPTTVVFETGGSHNCYCATASCTETPAQWQAKYVRTEPVYKHVANKMCSDMLWLASGETSTLDNCKARAELTGACAEPKTIAFESGNNHNCYCANTSACQEVASDWMSLYIIKGSENATSVIPTSTGNLYRTLTSNTLLV